jgi:hypothetical protein
MGGHGVTELVGREEELQLPAMVEGDDRRRPGGAVIWRTGHRQVSIDCRAA